MGGRTLDGMLFRERVRSALEWVFENVRILRPLMTRVNRAVMTPTFSGWGMLNYHAVPWDDPQWRHFEAAAGRVRVDFEHGLAADTAVTPENVDTLMWRHWIVAFCVRHVVQKTDSPLTLVECGVGDGLTAFFAATEAEHLERKYELHCYDTWGVVDTDAKKASYADLALDRTRRNLDDFRVIYHQGLIPDTFDDAAPETVDYLSIDLNAAVPTVAALEFFVPRLAPGGAVLFDDYGHRGYEDTRVAVDSFFDGRVGSLLKLPTGQAIWFS